MNTVPARPSLGCLIVHGFSGSLATVDGLEPHLAERGIPYELPVLRGHGATPLALRHVTWHDWYADGEHALDRLLERCDRAVVVGLSMGGLVALHLAVQRPERLAGVVAVAPALWPVIPAAFLLPLLARTGFYGTMRGEKAFMDTSRAAQTGNYPRVPVAAVNQLARFARTVEHELPQIVLPLLICYTPHDQLVRPGCFPLLYERVSTPPADKELLAFDRSGHELLFDQQREEVFAAILWFLAARQAAIAEPAQSAGI